MIDTALGDASAAFVKDRAANIFKGLGHLNGEQAVLYLLARQVALLEHIAAGIERLEDAT